MSTPANFNGQRPAIDANDAVMLLIDHQSGLFQTVGDMPMPELRARAAALAKIATLCLSLMHLSAPTRRSDRADAV
ncbi:hypothetical protein C9F10_21700, partial [Salmonella enterica subsp. enterica serovar Poona]